MPQQYHATDSNTGLQVTVEGDFPEDPDDRVRIARTSNLFTRLMATILSTENDYERRERFKAIETQLELADALIRGDATEVQQLIRSTLSSMGVTEDQIREAQRQLRSQLEQIGGDPSALEALFGGLGDDDEPPEEPEIDDRPLDDRL
jgi:endonuclease III